MDNPLKDLILALPKNKDYKREKIRKVEINSEDASSARDYVVYNKDEVIKDFENAVKVSK